MLVVCEQCHTKYVVPDEKVVKSVLRLPCQKCGHVITMRVEENSEQTLKPSSSTLGKWRSASLNTPRKLQNEAPAWYYSYNGESHGPFTELELKDKLLDDSMSEIAAQCYIWRKSFKEWKPVLEVEPFASALLMPPPPAPKLSSKETDENLPPLFPNAKSASETDLKSTAASSSPDLLRLKHRLKSADSPGSFSASQRESLAKLAATSSLFGKVEKDIQKQNDLPTHTQIPVIDDIPARDSDEEDVGDTTRVGQLSPLSSFQNLDAIISTASIENESNKPISSLNPISTDSNPHKEIKELLKEETNNNEQKDIEKITDSTHNKSKFPSVSSLSVKPKPSVKTEQKNTSAFGTTSKPVPGISSLFGSKSSSSISGNSTKTPSFGGLKSFSSLNSSKSSGIKPAGFSSPAKNPSTSFIAPLRSSSGLDSLRNNTLTQNKTLNSASAESKNLLPDGKKDIGEILKSNTSISEAASRDESISSWLPSQSELHPDTNLDEILLGDITVDHDIIDNAAASDSLPSFELDSAQNSEELPDLDIENFNDLDEKFNDNHENKLKADIPEIANSFSSLPDIDIAKSEHDESKINTPSSDINVENSENNISASDKDLLSSHQFDLNQNSDNIPASSNDGSSKIENDLSIDVLPDIDIEEDSLQLSEAAVDEAIHQETQDENADNDEQNVISAFEMLSAAKDTSANLVSEPNSELSEIGSIDLDEDNSQFFSKPEINTIIDNDSSQPQKSGIVEYDMLFDDVPEEPVQSVARASHKRLSLDEIAEQHKALFEESEKLEKEREDESSVSESSMLIQLNHFQKITEQDKRKSKFKVLAIAIPAIILFICLASGVWYAANDKKDEKIAQTGFASVKGSEISSDDLNEFAPEDEFEILDMSNLKPRGTSQTRRNSGGSDSVSESAISDAEQNSATDQAAEAIYGSQNPTSMPERPAVRQDGRAGVVLNNNSDTFGSTAAVSGSKYAKKGSSRELFALGLKRVSTSVQDCSRRITNKGGQMPQKVIMNLVIQPDGNVRSYEINDSAVPPEFNKCLSGKKDTWKFTPFEGNDVMIKQSFILG